MGGKYADRCTDRFHRCGIRILSAAIERLSLRYNTASLLEVESGSNDPCAYMLTVTFYCDRTGSASGGQIGLLIVKQMLFGILFGGLIAAAAVLLLKKIKFSTAGFDMVLWSELQ